MPGPGSPAAPLARLEQVGLRYGAVRALAGVDLELPAGRTLGLIGPDGVGKSSLLGLLAGARAVQQGRVEVFGGDMASAAHRRTVCPRIAYLPQGLGRNLYPTLSIRENLAFFGALFGLKGAERARRIETLTRATALAPFLDRPVGQLSGGMRQKLGLCCALIHDPDLLILDEPTTGVDPLSRRQFWELVAGVRQGRPGMSVVVATAYMEEAARFDWLVALDAGRVLAADTPAGLLARTGTTSLEAAFVALMPEQRRRGHHALEIPARPATGAGEAAIEARGLTRRFDGFTAVEQVSFRIERGEIFGFLGSNGCGKTTVMKMLTGLLPPSEGKAWLFGREVDPRALSTRRRVGYMSQFFSLYEELTVRQNLELHARLFGVPPAALAGRVGEMAERFELGGHLEALPASLPLGHRQRLSLAVALIHRPEVLILDEPTSGVDPVARDEFWRALLELSRRDGVTVFVSTHLMNEAERCDRVALMHAGRVLATGAPRALARERGAASLEQAFVDLLEQAVTGGGQGVRGAPPAVPPPAATAPPPRPRRFAAGRMASHCLRESLELRRDPLRLTLALLGSALLMFVMGYGLSLDVEDLSFAVLDRDRTATSRDYALNLAGSRYFLERPPLADHAELDRRMRAGELSLAIEIPPGFARDLARGRPVEIGAWVDGAMPQRAETALGYLQGMHAQWLALDPRRAAALAGPAVVEVRFRYNPNVESLVAMVPGVIPLLLMMIPSMLAALSVVREKELGSIVNFHVTPTTRLEFLLGKQLPYLALSLLSFLLLTVLAVTVFEVPLKGSFAALAFGAFLYLWAATALGLLISSFMRSQIAAIFGTVVVTLLPAVSFSGLIDPVSSLQGVARAIGELYPTTHFLVIARGAFSKALGFPELAERFLPLALAAVAALVASALLLRKQEA